MGDCTYKHVCAGGVSKYAVIGAHDYCHIHALASVMVFKSKRHIQCRIRTCRGLQVWLRHSIFASAMVLQHWMSSSQDREVKSGNR